MRFSADFTAKREQRAISNASDCQRRVLSPTRVSHKNLSVSVEAAITTEIKVHFVTNSRQVTSIAAKYLLSVFHSKPFELLDLNVRENCCENFGEDYLFQLAIVWHEMIFIEESRRRSNYDVFRIHDDYVLCVCSRREINDELTRDSQTALLLLNVFPSLSV